MAGTDRDTNSLANITIAGLVSMPSSVTLNGQNLTGGFSFVNGVLRVTGVEKQTTTGVFQQPAPIAM